MFRRILPALALLGLGLTSSGCVAAALPLAYSMYALSGTTMVAHTAIAAKSVSVQQQNAETYRLAVQGAQAGEAPQCLAPEARAACPLFQVRLGVYRAKCADGSGLDVSPGKLTVSPPPVERPHPWDAEGCTL